MKARYKKFILDFKRPSGTSRGVMKKKETWFLIVEEQGRFGIGECGLFRGLSADNVVDYEAKLQWTCANIGMGKDALWEALRDFPSIQFGVEQAFLSLRSAVSSYSDAPSQPGASTRSNIPLMAKAPKRLESTSQREVNFQFDDQSPKSASHDPFLLFASDFTEKGSPIPINGLIWMGDEGFMHDQIQEKLEAGFRCIKMKIGAISFEKEIALLASIRKKYTAAQIELRVDANGAFTPEDALVKLEQLAYYQLHSIEQPIRQGNREAMRQLCATTPLPIALDEELIGVSSVTEKEKLLQTIQPQYIILKPSLIGGYRGSQEWIDLADKMGIGWWVTSALESNIGLNAIAQWTYVLESNMPQGLGTGSLFANNFESPLEVEGGKLYYRKAKIWQDNLIQKLCT